jgi:hypothetical protein
MSGSTAMVGTLSKMCCRRRPRRSHLRPCEGGPVGSEAFFDTGPVVVRLAGMAI